MGVLVRLVLYASLLGLVFVSLPAGSVASPTGARASLSAGVSARDQTPACTTAGQRVKAARKSLSRAKQALSKARTRAAKRKARAKVSKAKRRLVTELTKQKKACATPTPTPTPRPAPAPTPPPPPPNQSPVFPTQTVQSTFNNQYTIVMGRPCLSTSSVSIALSPGASDPDGDALTYGWTASGGNISGAALSATWDRPVSNCAAQPATVTVTVADGKGGSAGYDIVFR